MEKMENVITNDGRFVDKANTVATQLNDRRKKTPYLDRPSSLPVHCYNSYGRALLVTAEGEGNSR
jgi:hypothetical protein